jgi:hypothetical protein
VILFDILAAILAVVAIGYLAYAIARPEKF